MGLSDTFENAVQLNCPKFLDDSPCVSMIGSCDGLLCFQRHSYDEIMMCLFNPTTLTHKMIPILPISSHVRNLPHEFIHGFGYDSVANDYKIVSIFLCYCEEMCVSYNKVMVYSLNSNSWTKVLDDAPFFSYGRHVKTVLVNENLHWYQEDNLEPSFSIVSFNLSAHGFGEVPMPDGVDPSTNRCKIFVGVLDGSLCMLINYSNEFEIFVMKEYGVVESWAKLFRIPKASDTLFVHRTIAFSKDRKKLLLALWSSDVS